MARRKTGRDLNGVLLFDKPYGLSSNNALQKARRLYDANKAGHSGALDPIATGLLPICFGRLTRLTHYVLGQDKRYSATLRLGQATTTGDTEGEILFHKEVAVTAEQVKTVLTELEGPQDQVPPMFSALKHQGKPLYEYARKGITIERSARMVNAYFIKFVSLKEHELIIDVKCSSGFYIRTLAEEIGRLLGPGAHLTALRRTEVGNLSINAATSLIELESMDMAQRDSVLIEPIELVAHMESISLSEEQLGCIKNGVRSAIEYPDHRELILTFNSSLVGVGAVKDGVLKPVRVFV